MIATRLVFLFPGFESLSANEHAERFCRGAAKSAETWGVEVQLPADRPGCAPHASDDRFPVMPIVLSGETWRTRTDVVLCDWGDLIGDYAGRRTFTRLTAGIRALGDFIATGTLFRYCRVSWRYALFFFYPIAILAFAAGTGALAALLPPLLDWSSLHLLWSVPSGVLCALAVAVFADKRLHLLTVLDDWAFAHDLCRARNGAIDARIDECRQTIARNLSQGRVDEALVVGHSLGASLAVVALADALADGKPASPVHVLTVGSSLLKTALHPAAERQRDAVRALVADHRLHWVDVQALSDPINFYRSNPALSLGIAEGRTPIVRRVSLRKLVRPDTYRRIKRNFFRLHRQFVFGVEKRQPYSFHMILLGPVSFERYADARSIDLPPLSADPAHGMCLESRMAAQ